MDESEHVEPVPLKARPRSVENRVAEELSRHFTLLGLPPVERIPVLGRTGPDLTVNALKLVVDVKSRIEVPKRLFFPIQIPFSFDCFMAVRLCNLETLWSDPFASAPIDFSSALVMKYWNHMEEWTAARMEGGISCVVLHRPEMPIGAAVAVIHQNSRRRLIEYASANAIVDPRQ